MSLSNSTRRRSFIVGESERGWKSQNRPWWAITSWAPASAACVEQIKVGGDARDYYRHVLRSGHLQPIWAIIREIWGLEQLVEIGDDVS